MQLGIQKPQPEQMNLEELWEQVRRVSAVTLAEDLMGDSEDHPIETNTMMQAVQRVLGNRGENQLTFDIGSLTDSLQAHWDTLGLDDEQKSAAHNIVAYFFMGIVTSAMKPAKPQHRELVRKIVESLPDGYGEAFFADPAIPIENAERFDLKTAIKLISSPCRING